MERKDSEIESEVRMDAGGDCEETLLEIKAEDGEIQDVEIQLNIPQPTSIEIIEENVQINCSNDNVGVEQVDLTDACQTDVIELDTSNDDVTAPELISDKAETSSCCITINFQDEGVADLYKSKFIKFINSFSELHIKNETDLGIEVYRDDSVILSDNTETCSPAKKRKKHSKAKRELFVLDATPSPNSIPTKLMYTSKFTISTEKNSEDTDDLNPTHPKRSSCFNCDESHQLRDCPYPKDFNKINAARQNFKSLPKSNRYHLEEEQKFSHLQPGRTSNELRKALGLHRDEAPHYIYLMRRLGYPPGWLEEAKFVHSNLDIIDIDGKSVKATVGKQGLDASKVVDYPGFNVPLQKGVKDDHRMYHVPPYSDDFSKETMISFFAKKFPEVEDNMEPCDMELVDEPPEISPQEERDSPSLVDLEQQKQQLLNQLNDETKVETITLDSDSDKDFLTVKTSCFGTPILKSTSPFVTIPNADNFSKDVSPVINFENLPNATGKYERLSDVLHKVRDTLKKINDVDS